MSWIPGIFSRGWAKFLFFQALILLVILWIIAGNDRLFRSTVPIEQRLVSRNETIRKKAQQELLGLDASRKQAVASDLIPSLQSPDPFVIKWTAISLALIGPSAQPSIPFLLQAASAKEKDAAQAVRVALSEIGAPDSQQLPSLLRTLQDPRNPVRCESALSIGKMGSNAKDAIPVLLNYLQQDESPPCFEQAVASLALSEPGLYPRLLEILQTPRIDLRRRASHVLALSGAREPATIARLLDTLATEADLDTRKNCAMALQLPYVPEMNAEDVFSAALKARELAVRLEAARQVRGRAPFGRQYLGLIIQMMKDSDSQVRRLGLEALRRTGQRSPDLLQRVARAQRDEDPGVRCRAAESLIEAGSFDRVSIALLMNDLRRDEDVARCAENALSMAGLFDTDVIYSMIHLLQTEKDPDVRSRAAQILMHMGPRARQAVPALMRARDEKVPGAEMALRSIRGTPARKGR